MRCKIIVVLLVTFYSCQMESKKEDRLNIEYSVFIPKEITIQGYDNYIEKMDSILIITDSLIIIFKGEFAMSNTDRVQP